jgi:integrase
MQAWIRGIKGAPSSVRQVVKDVSAVFAAAVDDQVVGRNPLRAASIRMPKVTASEAQPWTADEIAAVAAKLPDRFEALAWLGASTGMRQGELVGFSVPDLDFLRRNAHVDCQIRRTNGGLMFAEVKNHKSHDVPVGVLALERLAEHIRKYPPRAVTLPWQTPDGKPVTRELIFTLPNGKPLSGVRLRQTWAQAVKDAGLPGDRPNGTHALRHTAASVWLSEGLSLAMVAAFLGDSKVTILATYAHFMPGDDTRARKVMDRFLAGAAEAPAETSAPPG